MPARAPGTSVYLYEYSSVILNFLMQHNRRARYGRGRAQGKLGQGIDFERFFLDDSTTLTQAEPGPSAWPTSIEIPGWTKTLRIGGGTILYWYQPI